MCPLWCLPQDGLRGLFQTAPTSQTRSLYLHLQGICLPGLSGLEAV